MSNDFAWELFKNTGNLDAFMIMKNIENVPKSFDGNKVKNEVLGDINGDSKN